MRIHRAPSARVLFGFVLAACALALAPAPALARQGGTPGPPPPGNRDPFGEIRERQQREAQLRSAEMVGASKTGDRLSAEAAAGQLREDFKRIQILRNNVVRHLKSDKPLDYKFINGEAEEINKRATRLRTLLAHLRTLLAREVAGAEKKLPEKQVELADAQLKDALVTMCKRIDSFTENPVFKTPDVVDVEQSAKADRDLRHVILLSDAVKRLVEKLNKTADGKTN